MYITIHLVTFHLSSTGVSCLPKLGLRILCDAQDAWNDARHEPHDDDGSLAPRYQAVDEQGKVPF